MPLVLDYVTMSLCHYATYVFYVSILQKTRKETVLIEKEKSLDREKILSVRILVYKIL